MERRTIFTIFVLAVLALTSQVAVWVFRPHDQVPAFIGPPRSDYTLADFSIDALDDTGKLSFTVRGPRLTHKEDDGSVYVDTPDYVIVDNAGNTWNGKSEAAWVNKDGTIMRLEGHVVMHRQATTKVKPADIVTSDLTTWPKDKKMETAAPVTMTDPDSILSGTGMKSDLGLKVLELFANVHSILQPKHRDAPQG
ncbi:MAG TPA: LPS export ABC transporter periplasmic protein LptC [Rudaea sp.]|nr:LPS export ABC transporter periplasmic protein LptC [Rudaea sp.]